MKSRILISVIVVLILGVPVFAQTTAQTPQRSMREIVMMPVVYTVPGMDKVSAKTNIKYTNVADPNLLMDVYTPPNLTKTDKLPAVIFVHGGAGSEFTAKDWGIYTSWGRLIAASGLAAVTFTHRLTPQKRSIADSGADLQAGIDHVRRNADSLNIDKDRLCLAAFSAGGALLAPAIRDKPPYIRCLVNFYAFMDVQQAGNLFVPNETKEDLRKFSPIVYLDQDAEKIPPIFIGRAGRDQVATIDDSIDRFVKEALAKNVSITVANHPTGVHGFDNQDNDDRSKEIIRMAIEFLKIHLITSDARK
jgi:acetyl esterase/lipase